MKKEFLETQFGKKTYFRSVGLVYVYSLLIAFVIGSNVSGQTGIASAVPTFHCIGITWSNSGGSVNMACTVQYKEEGSNQAWKNGYPLWFDSREVGTGTRGQRPANEYRGSITGLKPGTAYRILLTAGSAKNEFVVTTWNETFPVAATIPVVNSDSTLKINTSGNANGYRLYTPQAGKTATIDVANSDANCIYIDAAYIIIRGLVLKGAAEDAIILGPNAHDVIIENNDISGWGYIGMGSNNQAAVRIKGYSYDATRVERIIIQRNKIHNPRDNSNSWDDGGHPLGPNGINFEEAGGNHVIRYNEIYSDASHYFMDGIGGADNFSFSGFPNSNSDIYSNIIKNCYDDAIESEGGNCNVRIWGNFMDRTFTGIASATNSVGPLYIFRNISNISQRSPSTAAASTIDNEDRGPFNKCGSPDSTFRGGRTYLFHNTVLQPIQNGFTYPRGMGGGPVDNGGPVRNIFSRNNIWQTFKEGTYPAIAEWQSGNNNGDSYDYDLYNGDILISSATSQEAHGVKGVPSYANGIPLTGPNPAGYYLLPSSRGTDKGEVLNGFNDGYNGIGPDIGAYEIGKPALQFGVNAYLPGASANQPPVAQTGNDLAITSPDNSAQLNGSHSFDADGVIVSYAWQQVSGPNDAAINDRYSPVAVITGLIPGIYTFELTVTDNDGFSSDKTMKIMVESSNGQTPAFSIYPNPVSGMLNIQYASRLTGRFRISIFDADMRLVWNDAVEKEQVFMYRTIDVGGFASGVYFNQVISYDGKEISIKRFVKM